MKNLIFCVIFIVFFAGFFSTSVADDKIPDSGIGLMAAYQGSQFDFNLPIWAGSKLQIVPSIGFVNVSDNITELFVGIGGKMFVRKEIVSPYIGVKAGLFSTTPERGGSTMDIMVGIGFGGEYFISRYLSTGVEFQLNMIKSDDKSVKYGNPGGTNFNTATVAFLTVYF